MRGRTSRAAVWMALLAPASLMAWGGVAPAERPLKAITFLTNYTFIGRHAPFFIGLDRGFYRDAGFALDVLPATGSAFVISALEGGQVDYGMVEAASLVQAVGQGARAKAFGVFMDLSTSGLASLVPFRSPASVAGRTVAASLTDSARVILPSILTRRGLDPSRVRWLAADPGLYAALLLGGQADLVTASIDSDVATLRRVATPRGQTVYFSSFAGWGYDVYGYFLVTQADRLVSHPDEVRAFAAATVRSVRYGVDHPGEAARAVVRHSPTLDYATALAHWRESIKAINTPSVEAHGYGVATEVRLQRTIDFVRQAFDMDAPPRPRDIYARGFMRR